MIKQGREWSEVKWTWREFHRAIVGESVLRSFVQGEKKTFSLLLLIIFSCAEIQFGSSLATFSVRWHLTLLLLSNTQYLSFKKKKKKKRSKFTNKFRRLGRLSQFLGKDMREKAPSTKQNNQTKKRYRRSTTRACPKAGRCEKKKKKTHSQLIRRKNHLSFLRACLADLPRFLLLSLIG